MKRMIPLALTLLLAGCAESGMEELRQFVEHSGRDLQGRVDPLPEVKLYEPFTYSAFDLPDPFKPRKLTVGKGGGNQPDLSRPREPLESFALETLKVVGVMARRGVRHAVVRAPDNALYHVRVGNYLGQDFGRIVEITDTQITVKENVQDSAGDWAERISTLILQE